MCCERKVYGLHGLRLKTAFEYQVGGETGGIDVGMSVRGVPSVDGKTLVVPLYFFTYRLVVALVTNNNLRECTLRQVNQPTETAFQIF